MSTQLDLPEPACRLGYTATQLEEILGGRLDSFWDWMLGQTVAVCRKTDCGPHGTVVYRVDVEMFLAGRQPLD